jgi:tRNA modification GTPase
MLVTRLILALLLQHGARMAEPGEFTQRAFLNGRLDLAQAEAVADLIHARTELSLQVAREQLAGRLSARIRVLRDALMLTLAHIEAHLDFPDEDISPDTHAGLLRRLTEARLELASLCRTAPEGQLLRRGIRAAIIGRPNAGKSSLLNLLLGFDRAIVAATAGTTRDTIEETANVRGLPVVFVDTAGLRHSEDVVEAEGIRRSREAAGRAELLLHVLDGTETLHPDDLQLLTEFTDRPRVVVLNKRDLPRRLDLPASLAPQAPRVEVSCPTGHGLEALKDAVKGLVWQGDIGAEAVQIAINARHLDALRRSSEALEKAEVALQSQTSLELVAFDLRVAVNAVGEVVGATTTDDLLDRIFSTFCLGK